MALGSGILWGMSGTVGQYLFAYKGLQTHWLTTMRMVIAGTLMVAISLVKYRPQLRGLFSTKRNIAHLMVFSIGGLMFCQYTYLTAISHSNSATATALQYLGQVLILLVTCVQMRRLPYRQEAVALVLAIGGVFLLATHGDPGNLALTPLGLSWGLISAVSLMTYTLLPGPLIDRYGSIPVIGSGMLAGGILLSLAIRVWTIPVALDMGAVLGMAYIIILGTAVPYTLYLQSVSYIGGVKASMYACVETVSAAVATFLWLHTPLVAMDWLAFAMIVTMALLLAYKPKGKQ